MSRNPLGILLASASPRRLRLLRQLTPDRRIVVVAPGHAENQLPGESPSSRVLRLAREKVRAALDKAGPARCGCVLAISADTEIVVGDESLGKPENDDDARRMLRLLAGRAHVAVTGLCVVEIATGREVADTVETEVRFRPISEEEIAAYVATGEPRDKAGAYGIQGAAAAFVESVRGSYSNVVGLPLERLKEVLQREFGVVTQAVRLPGAPEGPQPHGAS